MEHLCEDEDFAEVFNVQIIPGAIAAFIDGGDIVHQYLLQFEGYNGIDILLLSETLISVHIHWREHKLFDQYLPAILSSCPIKEWLGNTVTVSHQPAVLMRHKAYAGN